MSLALKENFIPCHVVQCSIPIFSVLALLIKIYTSRKSDK